MCSSTQKLTSPHAGAIPESIGNLTNLTVLNLAANKLEGESVYVQFYTEKKQIVELSSFLAALKSFWNWETFWRTFLLFRECSWSKGFHIFSQGLQPGKLPAPIPVPLHGKPVCFCSETSALSCLH